MKRTFVLLPLLLLFSFSFFCNYAQEAPNDPYIELTTLYRGKDVFVQNPFNGSGQGFCVTKVIINDTLEVADQITSSAFQISLKNFEKCIDSVNIKIYHCTDCLPKFLGPELITPKLTAEFVSISVDSAGLLKWETKNESWVGMFYIHRQDGDVWKKVESLQSLGGECFRDNEYFVTVMLTEGENTFRVIKALRGSPVISDTVTINK